MILFNLCNKLILSSSNLDFPGTKYKVLNVICILYPGGAGGDGGNGVPGKSNLDKIPVNPANAPEVYSRGSQVDYVNDCVTDQCCTLCLEYWYHALDINTDACGGSGGNGGNGGDGGAAGSLKLIPWKTVNSNIEIINTRLRSNGGSLGSGGVQASGVKCNRHFTSYYYYGPSTAVCYGHIYCEVVFYQEGYGGYGYTNNDIDCPGVQGLNGQPGVNWEP